MRGAKTVIIPCAREDDVSSVNTHLARIAVMGKTTPLHPTPPPPRVGRTRRRGDQVFVCLGYYPGDLSDGRCNTVWRSDCAQCGVQYRVWTDTRERKWKPSKHCRAHSFSQENR